MINSMQQAIIKKDLKGLVFNKRLFPALLIVPLMFTLVMPVIFILVIHFGPDDLSELRPLLEMLPVDAQMGDIRNVFMGIFFNNIMPVFFMIIPIMAATIMAASSFVGEKEKRTLETLLYCPLTLKQIFQSKVFASFFLSMLVSLGSFIILLLVVQTGCLLTAGNLMPPNANWLITLLLVAPSVSLMAITIIVRGSAKSQTMEEAQQKAVFLILPMLMLIIGQFTGVLLVNAWLLLGLGAVFALASILLMKGGIRNFSYEKLLR